MPLTLSGVIVSLSAFLAALVVLPQQLCISGLGNVSGITGKLREEAEHQWSMTRPRTESSRPPCEGDLLTPAWDR